MTARPVESDRQKIALRSAIAREHRLIDAGGALLWLDDVFKVYQQGDVETVALRGASLRVDRGEFVAIIGPSGSGKTTLLNLVAGLDRPTAGRVVIDGIDVSKLDEERRAVVRRHYVGVVYQESNLIPFLSAWENAALPLRLAGRSGAEARERARSLLDRLGMGARLHHRPSQLSGGEMQRAAIAVALGLQPALLVADELTGELDTGTTEEVMALLRSLNRDDQLTLLIVTHNDRVASNASRVVRMVDAVLGARRQTA